MRVMILFFFCLLGFIASQIEVVFLDLILWHTSAYEWHQLTNDKVLTSVRLLERGDRVHVTCFSLRISISGASTLVQNCS